MTDIHQWLATKQAKYQTDASAPPVNPDPPLPAPVAQEDARVTALEAEVATLRGTIDRLLFQMNGFNARIGGLAEQFTEFERRYAPLLDEPVHAGTFPPLNEIQWMGVQVFHSTNLTEKQIKGRHAPWSLRFEVTHRGTRQKAINIALWSPYKARNMLIEKHAADHIIGAVTALQDHPKALVGLVQPSIPGQGKPYLPSQVALLLDYDTGPEDCTLHLFIGHDTADIAGFVPSARRNSSSADETPSRKPKKPPSLYYAKWLRPKR